MSITFNLAFMLLGFVLIMLTGREFAKLNRYLSQVRAPAVRKSFTTLMAVLSMTMAIVVMLSTFLVANISASSGHGIDLY